MRAGKRVAILQSNYLPWKGYFDIVNMVDEFIFHDDLQFTKNDWRNRNRIKTPRGPQWITIPCGSNERRLICEVTLDDPGWQKKHWNAIQEHYRKAEHFEAYRPFFEDFYLNRKWGSLSELNQYLVRNIAEQFLNAETQFRDSREFDARLRKGERVLELLEKTGADEYVSGPAAKDYLDEAEFEKKGIRLTWVDYAGYPEYRQAFPPFEHAVSIIDLLFHEGPRATEFMKSYA